MAEQPQHRGGELIWSARWNLSGISDPRGSPAGTGVRGHPRRRILFAWEFGANFGHLARDIPLARLCRDRGFEVFMAVADLLTARQLLANEGFTLVQAPRLRRPNGPRRLPVNYPDMLLSEGYEDEAALAGALAGWAGLIGLIQPACLVFDHAPTALLAARIAGVPAAIMGTGFEIPPPDRVAPSFRPWQNIPEAHLHSAERQCLARMNALLRRAHAPALERLCDLFPVRATCFMSFEELDPFGPRPNARHLGPVSSTPTAIEVGWESRGGVRVFAYLRPTIPRVEQLLEALLHMDGEVLCVMPGIPDAWRQRFKRMRCVAHPVDMSTALRGADIVISHGTNTIAQALLAGCPVLLIPQVVEQYLSGLPVEKLAAGLILKQDRSIQACQAALTALVENSRYRQMARAFAQRHADFRTEQAALEQYAVVAALCEGGPSS